MGETETAIAMRLDRNAYGRNGRAVIVLIGPRASVDDAANELRLLAAELEQQPVSSLIESPSPAESRTSSEAVEARPSWDSAS